MRRSPICWASATNSPERQWHSLLMLDPIVAPDDLFDFDANRLSITGLCGFTHQRGAYVWLEHAGITLPTNITAESPEAPRGRTSSTGCAGNRRHQSGRGCHTTFRADNSLPKRRCSAQLRGKLKDQGRVSRLQVLFHACQFGHWARIGQCDLWSQTHHRRNTSPSRPIISLWEAVQPPRN